MRFPTVTTPIGQRPLVPVQIESSSQRLMVDMLVDTGADICLLPESLAARLGVDLNSISQRSQTSALGTSVTYRPLELTLELRRPPQVLRWKAQVGFLGHRMTYGILGTRGFFEFFALQYHAHGRWLEIEPAVPLPI